MNIVAAAPILEELARKRDEACRHYNKEVYKDSIDNWEFAIASMVWQEAINVVCRHVGLADTGLHLHCKSAADGPSASAGALAKEIKP